MIKINLIPAKRKKKRKPVPKFIVAMVLLIVLSGIAGAYASYYFGQQVSQLETKKQANAKRIAALQKKIKEVKNFEKLNQIFMKRQQIIEQLTKNQKIPVMILDEISRGLTDGVWLTTMSINGMNIKLSGVGFSNTDIVSFIQSLKGSKSFKNVKLLGTTRLSGGKTPTYKFDITLKFKREKAPEAKGKA